MGKFSKSIGLVVGSLLLLIEVGIPPVEVERGGGEELIVS